MSCHWSTVGFEGGAPEAKLPGLAGQSPFCPAQNICGQCHAQLSAR